MRDQAGKRLQGESVRLSGATPRQLRGGVQDVEGIDDEHVPVVIR